MITVSYKRTAILKIIDVRYQLSTVFSTSLLLETVEIMITGVNYYEIGSSLSI